MMRNQLTAILMLILALCANMACAHAEECFTINVDALDMTSLRDPGYVEEHLTAQTQGIRVQKYISASDELAARVRLTLQQMDTGAVIFDKNYNYQSGIFSSGDIYLPYSGNGTIPYLVTLYVEDWVYAMPFICQQPRLTDNGACTGGIRLRDVDPALTADWLMGTMLDLNALRMQRRIFVPLYASNTYVVGQAIVTLAEERLSVSLSFLAEANVEVQRCAIYVVRNVAEMTTADPLSLQLPAYREGEGADVSGADSVLLYIPMRISYDPSGLRPIDYSPADEKQQLALWEQNQEDKTGLEPDLPGPEWQDQEWQGPAFEGEGFWPDTGFDDNE